MDDSALRLFFPQWQGGDFAGYYYGARLVEQAFGLGASESWAEVEVPEPPVPSGLVNTTPSEGLCSPEILAKQLRMALDLLAAKQPARVLTIGGDCAVSLAPFSYLAARYGRSMAVIWIDAHADMWVAEHQPHLNAMAASTLTGGGHRPTRAMLPAKVDLDRVLWVGLRAEYDARIEHREQVLASRISPRRIRREPLSVVARVLAMGCTRVAIHLDVDSLDPSCCRNVAVGEPGGLSYQDLEAVVASLGEQFDVVGLTIAEYMPRDIHGVATAVSPAVKGMLRV